MADNNIDRTCSSLEEIHLLIIFPMNTLVVWSGNPTKMVKIVSILFVFLKNIVVHIFLNAQTYLSVH